jgi:predicted DNA-binding transcriptional regulator YafY
MDEAVLGYTTSLEELKRVSRILELVQIVANAPRRYLRRDLAHKFEISERMIQKDLQIIRHGLRLTLEHTFEGYYFEEMPRLPALKYTFSEALSILLAVQAARQISGVESIELSAAIARMETLFPTEFRPALRQMNSPIPLTVQGEHRQEMLILLNRALLQRRKLRILYETRSRGGEINERVVHPYALMPYIRSWQIVSYCELRKRTLIFKVDRIREAAILGEKYQIPADFDLDEYLGAGWGLMRGEAKEPEDVCLCFDSDAGHWAAEEHWHASQTFTELPDGRMEMHLHVAITPEFINWLLYYGARVVVCEPCWLREAVREAHMKAVERYE